MDLHNTTQPMYLCYVIIKLLKLKIYEIETLTFIRERLVSENR
jgi:hypothetical protein